MTATTTDLREQLERLLGSTVYTDEVPDDFVGGPVWGVWDNDGDDVLGSGDSESEALADAIETVRGWENA